MITINAKFEKGERKFTSSINVKCDLLNETIEDALIKFYDDLPLYRLEILKSFSIVGFDQDYCIKDDNTLAAIIWSIYYEKKLIEEAEDQLMLRYQGYLETKKRLVEFKNSEPLINLDGGA